MILLHNHGELQSVLICAVVIKLVLMSSLLTQYGSFLFNCSIAEISTESPTGLIQSDLTTKNSRESYINVTWTPSASQQGARIFCYTATDSIGWGINTCISSTEQTSQFPLTLTKVSTFWILSCSLPSARTCITLLVGGELYTNRLYIIIYICSY